MAFLLCDLTYDVADLLRGRISYHNSSYDRLKASFFCARECGFPDFLDY
jgi:hypothetical protein